MSAELTLYRELLAEIKNRVRVAQHKAALSANAEMIRLYWDIGRMIQVRQQREGWGAGVIPRLAMALKNELPEQKGFSERNIGHMIRFAREYGVPPILQQAAAKLENKAASLIQPTDQSTDIIGAQAAPQLLLPPQILFGLPWFHHVILIQKLKDLPTRFWYASYSPAARGRSAPTVRSMSAQGNALGLAPTLRPALKGRSKISGQTRPSRVRRTHTRTWAAPSGLGLFSFVSPSALPWAGLGCPVGASETAHLTAEIAKAFAESEFEKYRVVQDRLHQAIEHARELTERQALRAEKPEGSA